jgi:hypothetical protein
MMPSSPCFEYRRLRTDTGPRRRDLYMHLGVPLFRAGDGADPCIRVVQPDDIDYSKLREVGKLAEGSEAAY